MAQYKTLQRIVAPVVEAEGFEFWGLEFAQHKNNSLLRVYIESKDGISVDDCARVSRELSVVLDVEDPIVSEYRLEVSSPGMARRFFSIEQYQEYLGATLKVKLHTLFEGRRQLKGVLSTVDLENQELGLAVEDEEYLLPYELIDKAHIAPEFK